jgi:hypothetical protein
MVQLPRCNENCIEHLMHFQVPYFGIMEDLANIVHWVLDGTTSPWGFSSSTTMGSDPDGSWLPGFKNASGCRRVVASRVLGPEWASRSWDAVALLVPPWDSGAGDTSESWDPATTRLQASLLDPDPGILNHL